MKEKSGAATLGEMLLFISRDERIEKALARLGPVQASMVVADAIASLQRFLEGYGSTVQAGESPVVPPAPRKPMPAIPPAAGTTPAVPPAPRKPMPAIPPAARITPAGGRTPVPPVAAIVKPLPVDMPQETVLPRGSQAVVSAPPEEKKGVATLRPAAAAAPAERASIPGPMPTPHVESTKRSEPESPPVRTQAAPLTAPVNSLPADPQRIEPGPPARALPVLPELAPRGEKAYSSGARDPKTDSALPVQHQRESYDFEEQQAYLHGVSLIPLRDSPSPAPFLIEGQGLDRRSRMFAVDHAGMRFYLSELNQDSYSVSKNGLLLLNKTDSMRLRGWHESILNRLRIHTTLLPAEFGTAVLGKDDLARRVEFRMHALLEFVLDLGKTTMWRVTASVMDDTVMHFLADGPAPQRTSRRDTEHGRHAAPEKRTDVKSLERLLSREKKIAELILDILVPVAESHRIEHLVNLGSGRSEDWKSILTAVFTLAAGQSQRFFQAVVEVETVQSMVDPMLRVTGTTESFSLLM